MQWKCLLLLMTAAVGVNSQANIDTLEPIYRSFPDTETNNEYFGYSVVLHQLSVPTNRANSLSQTRYVHIHRYTQHVLRSSACERAVTTQSVVKVVPHEAH